MSRDLTPSIPKPSTVLPHPAFIKDTGQPFETRTIIQNKIEEAGLRRNGGKKTGHFHLSISLHNLFFNSIQHTTVMAHQTQDAEIME